MNSTKPNNSAIAFIGNMASFSLATVIGYILSFVSAPITTRLFDPEEMGKINLFLTCLNMLLVVSYFGLDQAFIRFYNEPLGENSNKGMLLLCNGLTLLFSGIITIFILVFRSAVSIYISGVDIWIIPVCLIVSMYCSIFMRYTLLVSRMEIKIISYNVQTILSSLVSKFIIIIAALRAPTHEKAIVALTIGYIAIAVAFFWTMRANYSAGKIDTSPKVLRTLFKFSLPLLPASVLSTVNNSIPQFMLKSLTGDYSAIGIYSYAVAIAGIVSLIQAGFNIFWSPYVYRNYKEAGAKIKRVHNTISSLMVLMALFILLGQDIIYLLLGEKFRLSKPFFAFLLLSPVCYTIAETTGIGINISTKTYWNTVVTVVSVALNLLLAYMLVQTMGVAGMALAAGLSSVVMLIAKTIIGEKFYSCITSYYKTFSGIGILTAAAIVNYLFFEHSLQRYILIFILICVEILIYRKDLIYLFNVLLDYGRSLRKIGRAQ